MTEEKIKVDKDLVQGFNAWYKNEILDFFVTLPDFWSLIPFTFQIGVFVRYFENWIKTNDDKNLIKILRKIHPLQPHSMQKTIICDCFMYIRDCETLVPLKDLKK